MIQMNMIVRILYYYGLALLLTISVVVHAQPSTKAFGIQSGAAGFDGSSYASAMSYDADRDLVFVTGATYSSFFDVRGTQSSATNTSGCFLSILKIAADTAEPSFLYKERYGTDSVVESCSSLTRSSSKIYVGGQSEAGGLLTSLNSGSASLQYGIILDIEMDLQSGDLTASKLLGGRLLHKNPVESVRAMVLNPSGESIFAVSQFSDLTTINDAFDPDDPEPNLVEQPKWGYNFALNVIMFNHRSLQSATGSNPATTFNGESWNQEIASNLNPVDIAGITLFSEQDLLLVAGSAIGSNGTAIPSSGTSTDTWAGFVTILSATSGAVTNAILVDTQVGKATRIEGICRHLDREDEIYLVGSTNGLLEGSDYLEQEPDELTAFVMRVTVPDLTVSWTKQINAKPGPLSMNSKSGKMTGRACAVTDDGVYVGGVVADGSIVNDERHTSAGMDDIWVGFVNSATRQFVWTRQLGTPDDENLAALEVDKNGDVLVLGNSNGSFMRRKNEGDTSMDLFLLRLTKLEGLFGSSVPVAAGSGTPVAAGSGTPVAAGSGTPVAAGSGTPVAASGTPVAAFGTPAASPVATPAASPVAPPTASPVAPPTESPAGGKGKGKGGMGGMGGKKDKKGKDDDPKESKKLKKEGGKKA